MRNPRLSGKIILSTALLLILTGMLSSIVYSNFQGFISASHGKTTAVPLEMIEGSKQVDVLSRTSPSWRRKLSKHIFITIDQELQSLEQQLILHDSAEGQRLIGRVKISLQRMIFGKQKFVRTGREASLASFYTGRTVLEYNLWKLKGLTQGLNMDRAQARGVHRIYALMNKWLIYVAHREINALRKGILDASPQAEAANTAFPQISEVTKITEQDFEKADKALSQQPTAVQETAPDISSEIFEPETRQDPQPNLTLKENAVSPQSFEEEANSSPGTVSIPNWMLTLGAVGILIVLFLIFRRKRKPSHLQAFYNRDDPLERHNQSTEDLVEIHTLIEPGITEATREEWPNYSETEESVTDSEAPEGIPSQTTVNEFEDKAQEDMTFQLEELTQELETLNAEKEEYAQGLESILAENNSLTKKLDTFHEEKESLEKQLEALNTEKKERDQELETLNAEKEEFTQGLENILAENDSLTEKLEICHTEKESLEKQLETLNAEKKESSQGLESILAENGFLMENLETSHEEKEGLEKQLENIQSREEKLVQVLESTLNENDPLNEKLETFYTEKESLERQLEILHTEKEELAQEQENTLMENNSLMKQLKTSHKEKDHLAQEQNNTYVKLKATTKTLESSREKNKTLTKEQKSIHAKIKTLTKQFKAAQEKNKTIAKQNKTLANQLEGMQTENDQTTELEQDLTRELEAMSAEADVILLQTILKTAKGFRNINKRLHKIAEARLAPSIKDSPGDLKEKDSRET